MPGILREHDWEILAGRIAKNKCTPLIGAGACAPHLPLGSEIAQEWAQRYKYPFEDTSDLARVAQFRVIDTEEDQLVAKEEIAERFGTTPPPDFARDLDEPHAVLARLPLPVYITTNYDDFMTRALEAAGKEPQIEVCGWNQFIKDQVPCFDATREYVDPTPARPLVFHLHGHWKWPESLVLTEDDYLEFLVRIAEDPNLPPPRIKLALTGAQLLFMGYSMADWDFRVLYRALVGSLASNVRRDHISVQVTESDEARKYLDRYFKNLNVSVYWGTARQFAHDLRSRL
jgi:SIR2-like domain